MCGYKIYILQFKLICWFVNTNYLNDNLTKIYTCYVVIKYGFYNLSWFVWFVNTNYLNLTHMDTYMICGYIIYILQFKLIFWFVNNNYLNDNMTHIITDHNMWLQDIDIDIERFEYIFRIVK